MYVNVLVNKKKSQLQDAYGQICQFLQHEEKFYNLPVQVSPQALTDG